MKALRPAFGFQENVFTMMETLSCTHSSRGTSWYLILWRMLWLFKNNSNNYLFITFLGCLLLAEMAVERRLQFDKNAQQVICVVNMAGFEDDADKDKNK